MSLEVVIRSAPTSKAEMSMSKELCVRSSIVQYTVSRRVDASTFWPLGIGMVLHTVAISTVY